MSRTYLTFGDIAGKLHMAADRMRALRTQGTRQRCQAYRSARPPRQHEQVGVRPQGRLPETERRSNA